jgi:hypothetical protein
MLSHTFCHNQLSYKSKNKKNNGQDISNIPTFANSVIYLVAI